MDCNQIRKVAANALITCNIHSFPIDCFAILKQYGFRVYSYLELQKKKPELYNLCISYSQDAFLYKQSELNCLQQPEISQPNPFFADA